LINHSNATTIATRPPENLRFEASFGAFVLVAALALLGTMHLGFVPGAIAAALVIASLLIHEAGHLLAAKLCGVRVKAIGLCVKGAYLRRKDSKRAGAELLIAICGPLASILMFFILRGDLPVFHWVAQLNLVVALSNLLPIPSTDGARIARALVAILSAA
jgi:stage IV sporulation protein FB